VSSTWLKRTGPLALVIALLLVLVSEPPFVFGLRHALFDGYQRLFPRERKSAPAVIVAIDERALERHGQWPWPRTRVAQLLAGIADASPAAIGVDLLFPEPDRFSPAQVAREVQELSADVARRLRALPSNDAALATALKGRAVVLGVAGLEVPDPRFQQPPAAGPVLIGGGSDLGLRRFAGHLQSLPDIDLAAAGRGLLSVDPESAVIRRALAAARIGEVIVPALSVEMLRVASGAPLALLGQGRDRIEVRLGDVSIPAHADGRFWIRYGPHDPARFVSATEVLEGSVGAQELQDKLVLVGVTGLGLLDYQTTALGERIPGVEIHAQILEQIFDGAFLRRPATLHVLELGLLAVAALMFALTVPSLGVATSIALYAVVIALLAALGIEGFLLEGLLLDVAWPSIGATVVFGIVLAQALSEADEQRRRLREQAARVSGELESARRIQMGLLPAPRELFAHEPRFAIDALLEPARTVGGDFYDCFMVDSRRLFFVVADVSGKGLRADGARQCRGVEREPGVPVHHRVRRPARPAHRHAGILQRGARAALCARAGRSPGAARACRRAAFVRDGELRLSDRVSGARCGRVDLRSDRWRYRGHECCRRALRRGAAALGARRVADRHRAERTAGGGARRRRPLRRLSGSFGRPDVALRTMERNRGGAGRPGGFSGR
jgi:CHASE2 domain-containing sensor protein